MHNTTPLDACRGSLQEHSRKPRRARHSPLPSLRLDCVEETVEVEPSVVEDDCFMMLPDAPNHQLDNRGHALSSRGRNREASFLPPIHKVRPLGWANSSRPDSGELSCQTMREKEQPERRWAIVSSDWSHSTQLDECCKPLRVRRSDPGKRATGRT